MARRFVTYNTEDQAAGLINVDEKGVMMPGGLPSITDETTNKAVYVIGGEYTLVDLLDARPPIVLESVDETYMTISVDNPYATTGSSLPVHAYFSMSGIPVMLNCMSTRAYMRCVGTCPLSNGSTIACLCFINPKNGDYVILAEDMMTGKIEMLPG